MTDTIESLRAERDALRAEVSGYLEHHDRLAKSLKDTE